MYYRQRIGDTLWHPTQDCSGWPEKNFSVTTEPAMPSICPECRAKDNSGGNLPIYMITDKKARGGDTRDG